MPFPSELLDLHEAMMKSSNAKCKTLSDHHIDHNHVQIEFCWRQATNIAFCSSIYRSPLIYPLCDNLPFQLGHPRLSYSGAALLRSSRFSTSLETRASSRVMRLENQRSWARYLVKRLKPYKPKAISFISLFSMGCSDTLF